MGVRFAPGKHVLKEPDQLVVNQPIRRQNLVALSSRKWLAGKVRHAAAGLFHQQNSRRRVPRIQIELPEGIQRPQAT